MLSVATKLQIPRIPFELIPKGRVITGVRGPIKSVFIVITAVLYGALPRILKNLAHRLTDNEQRA